MTVDCFLFFKELELLEIRIAELSEVVDWLVLVEAAETLSGKRKPLCFEENRLRFQDANICHVKIHSFPADLTCPWAREAFSRNAISIGLQCLKPLPQDLILMSDVDEIPRASKVREAQERLESGEIDGALFNQVLYYYYVNCRSGPGWCGTRMARYETIHDFQEFRTRDCTVIDDGGWHFSYLGGAERIREKVCAFPHTELNRPEFLDSGHLQRCLADGSDLFGRDMQFHFTPLEKNLPEYLLENRSSFGHLISDRSTMP